jgi:CO/xanthine dehydrogenase Mo-binding subunit
MSRHRMIGRSIQRKDALEKVTGRAVYGADFKFPRQLYGAIYRSPLPHARILNVDPSRTMTLQGVRAVVTSDDYPYIYGAVIQDEPFLAQKKVRYVGEPIGAVAAEDPETALEAVSLVRVDFEELPPVLDIKQALEPGSPLVHENWAEYKKVAGIRPIPGTNICDHFTLRKGDIEAAWKESDVIVENEFSTGMLQHVTLETHCATALFEEGNRLTVWTPAQSPFIVRQYLSQALQMSMNNIRIIGTYIGGGFGSKYDLRAEQLAVVLALKARNRPVKVVFNRWEDFVGSVTRGQVNIKIKTGAKKDGTLVAQELKCYWDTGAYTTMGPRVSRNAGVAAGGPYVIPNIKIQSYTICTNKPIAGAYRGFGVPEINWAHENQMDALALSLNIDPLDLRLRNALEEGSISSTGERLFSVGLRESLVEAGRLIGWEKGKLREITTKGKLRGKGIACFWKMTSSPSNSSAVIKLNDDGTITVLQGGTEMGQGVNTVVAQITAEELGVSIDKVSVAPVVDTAFTPYDKTSTSSRVTFQVGNAVILAAKDVKDQLKKLVAKAWKIPVESVEIEAGTIFEKTADRTARQIEIEKITESGMMKEQEPVIGRGSFSTADIYVAPDVETLQSSRPTTFWIYGTQAAEVEVDPEIGTVEILKIAAAHDCGKALNPQVCLQQIEGSIVMGLGHALLEEMIFDQGKAKNANMVDYKVPTSMDFAPETCISLVEAAHPEGPYGAKGVGETALAPTAAAVGNAISNAVGVRFESIPIRPEQILERIKNGRRE